MSDCCGRTFLMHFLTIAVKRLLKLIEMAMGKPAVREDVAPPDPDDSYGEDEHEAELMEAADSKVTA